MVTFLLATLQQRWRCNAATRAHSDGVAMLLLELAAMALLQLAAALLELVVALCNDVGTRSGAMQRYWNS